MLKIGKVYRKTPKKLMSLFMLFAMLLSYASPITTVFAALPNDVNTYGIISVNGALSVEEKSDSTEIVATYENGIVSFSGTGLYSDGNNIYSKNNVTVDCTPNANNTCELWRDGNNSHGTTLTIDDIVANNVVNVDAVFSQSTNQGSNVEVQFDNATISGNVVTYNVNNNDVTLTLSGANITNNRLEVNRNDLANVSFILGNNYDDETMQLIVRGSDGYNQVLAVNNSIASLNGLNFPDGGLHLAIEPKNNGGENNGGENNDNHVNAGITVTAGAGTYGNNKSYDADIDLSINGSRWNHDSTIGYNVSNSDTTVTFTFETLWINKFYDDIVINGTTYNVSDYIDFNDRTQWLNANHGSQTLSFDIPNVAKADSYNVVVKNGENTGSKYLATFLWTADPAQASSDNYIGHSKLEFVKAVYYVGNKTYTVTEEDLEGKLQREGNFMVTNSDDGFLSYGITADVNYDDGSLTLPGDADVTMRVVPDYGYQVTGVNNGGQFTTTNEGVSEFTVHVAEGEAGYFQAEVTRVDDKVLANSNKVQSGNVEIANGDINSGTVMLSVDDIDLSADKITDFEKYAGNDYSINSYLDINLNKVLYKGTADDVWSEQIHHLNNKALVTLQLEAGVDVSNLVIVHNIDNGDQFETIKIESYDPETNTITFYTDSFSNYALATKTNASSNSNNDSSSNVTTTNNSNNTSKVNETTTANSTTLNPHTGDNIINYFIVLIISFAGLTYTGLALNKRKSL